MIPLINLNATEAILITPQDIFKSSFVDVDKKLHRQPVCISIGESIYRQNIYPIPFGSYGDYSCIVGSSKSKKSFFKSALMAGYIGGEANNYFGDIKGHDTVQKFVIDIDTEQSKYHAQRTFKRVIEMVGDNYRFYKPFSLREFTSEERMQFIEYLIYESPYKGNIGLISIDGYVDLINDFNSLEQSTMLSQKLLKWSSDASCHITGVLHKNFGSSKPVGHIGSTILKKAETVVFIENEDEFTSVKCKYSRNIPFDDFNFNVDENWLPKQVNKL